MLLFIDLLPFSKLLELLAIDHSLSERRIIFSPWLLKFSHVLVGFLTCMGAHFPAVELDNAKWLSILSRVSGFLWHSSKWACRFGRFLQYTSGLKVLACSLDIDVNYAPTALFPEPLNKVVSTFGVEMRQLLGVFSKVDT